MALSRTEAQRLAATDTSQVDQAQGLNLAAYLASEQSGHVYTPETLALIKQAEAATATAATDPEWAGPSLPHPSEATSPEEADELRQGWDDWKYGLEASQEQLEA